MSTDPENAASEGRINHYHISLTTDATEPERSYHVTSNDLGRAMDVADAFIRLQKTLYDAIREDGDPEVHTEVTQHSDVIMAPGAVCYEVTMRNPVNEGRDAVSRVTPCSGHGVSFAVALARTISDMIGAEEDDVVVKIVSDEELEQIKEGKTPTRPYRGGDGSSFSEN